MTLKDEALKKLGHLFMVGLPGHTLDASSRELIVSYGINNFIIFKRNVASPRQLAALCAALRDACRAAGVGQPLISIDQEGGTVARLPPPFTQFPDARTLAEGGKPEEALREYALTCARELLGVGINMNLAPVLDVCPAGQGYFMERRVLGAEAGVVARLGALLIETMQRHGLAACAKHFPGLGAAKLDPHEVLPVVDAGAEVLRAHDLPSFARAFAVDVAAVMTSHTIYDGLDPATPATLSPTILHDLLRREMGYDGLVITDDLEMGAIENAQSVAAASLGAMQAGADMLLICHDHEKVRASHARVSEALHGGELTDERILRAAARVAAVQHRFAPAR